MIREEQSRKNNELMALFMQQVLDDPEFLDAIPDKAEIICCNNNFHGRTITVISFSTDEQYRDGFGPLTPGFKTVPFGGLEALKQAITPNTVAFLAEPIDYGRIDSVTFGVYETDGDGVTARRLAVNCLQ